MARLTYRDMWMIASGQSWERRIYRGATNRAEISLFNFGPNACTYYVRALHMVPGLYDTHVISLRPPYFIPMHDGTYANLGTVGGNAALSSGSLVNTNPVAFSENNTTYQQVANGALRIAASPVFSTYNGPFAIEMFFYPTLISALTPLWREANAAITHFMDIYVDTDRRIGFRMNNGVSSFAVKDAAGPQVNVNAWNYLVFNYASPNFTAYVNTVAAAATSVGAGGLLTFSDANATLAGIVSGSNGYIAAPAAYNQTSVAVPGIANPIAAAPLPLGALWQHDLDMAEPYATTDLVTGALASSGGMNSVHGAGSGTRYPPILIVGLNNSAGDCAGYFSVTTED